jgi:hypothetical protein
MLAFAPLLLALFAVGRKPTTWFIDGNNLMGHKGTPRDRDQIVEKLKPMEGDLDVFVVFDARRGEGPETKVETDGRFSTVIMGEGHSADEFILSAIDRILDSGEGGYAQVVTADKDLRRQALETRSVVRGVVSPVTFWRRYRPRLTGLKKQEQTITCC